MVFHCCYSCQKAFKNFLPTNTYKNNGRDGNRDYGDYNEDYNDYDNRGYGNRGYGRWNGGNNGNNRGRQGYGNNW